MPLGTGPSLSTKIWQNEHFFMQTYLGFSYEIDHSVCYLSPFQLLNPLSHFGCFSNTKFLAVSVVPLGITRSLHILFPVKWSLETPLILDNLTVCFPLLESPLISLVSSSLLSFGSQATSLRQIIPCVKSTDVHGHSPIT